MNTTISLTVRVFPVRVRDERTGAESIDHIVLTREQLQAAGVIGMDQRELVRRIYSPRGYKVLEIGKPVKRTLSLDLYIAPRESYTGEIVAEGAELLDPTQPGGLQEERRDTEDVNTGGETAE